MKKMFVSILIAVGAIVATSKPAGGAFAAKMLAHDALWPQEAGSYAKAALEEIATAAKNAGTAEQTEMARWFANFINRPDVTIEDTDRMEAVLKAKCDIMSRCCRIAGICGSTNSLFAVADMVGRMQRSVSPCNDVKIARFAMRRDSPIVQEERLRWSENEVDQLEREWLRRTECKERAAGQAREFLIAACRTLNATGLSNSERNAVKVELSRRACIPFDEVLYFLTGKRSSSAQTRSGSFIRPLSGGMAEREESAEDTYSRFSPHAALWGKSPAEYGAAVRKTFLECNNLSPRLSSEGLKRWYVEFMSLPDVGLSDTNRLHEAMRARRETIFLARGMKGIADSTNACYATAAFVGRVRRLAKDLGGLAAFRSTVKERNLRTAMASAERSALQALKESFWWTGARNMTDAQKEACKTNIAERAMLSADEVEELFPNDFDPMRPLLWLPKKRSGEPPREVDGR